MEFSDSFNISVEDIEMRKTKKFERMWHISRGGSILCIIRIDENTLYFTDMDGYIYAVGTDGVEKWKFRMRNVSEASPSVYRGIVFAAGHDSYVYALDKKTGRKIWEYRTGGPIFSVPCGGGDLVFVGSKDGFLYALKYDTGELVWRFTTGDCVVSAPAYHEGRVFVGSFDNYLYCLTLTVK